MRRDFTTNCLYYFISKTQKISLIKKSAKIVHDEDLYSLLNKHGVLFFPNENLFILQSHALIGKLFADGKFQKDELAYVTNLLTEHTIVTLSKPKSESRKSQPLRFIIDPHK
jgi:hypothetical protein